MKLSFGMLVPAFLTCHQLIWYISQSHLFQDFGFIFKVRCSGVNFRMGEEPAQDLSVLPVSGQQHRRLYVWEKSCFSVRPYQAIWTPILDKR